MAKDTRSANGVMLSLLITAVCSVMLLGPVLWIPASRISSLPFRVIALACTDALEMLSRTLILHEYVEDLRSAFLSVTGLESHPAWDTRYYNLRPEASLPEPAESSGHVKTPTDESMKENIDGGASEAVSTDQGPVASLAARTSPSLDLPLYSPDNPLRLYFFGDSQVYSLGHGLSRLCGKEGPFDITVVPVHSTGFIRMDYYNWIAKLTDVLAADRYDAAVVMLGMNDHQNFWNSQGEIVRTGTDKWEQAYGERCRAVIDAALLNVRRVYWIAMPLVKNKTYNGHLRYIDRVQDTIAAEYSPDLVVRIPLVPYIPGEGQEWKQVIDLPSGSQLRAMSDDGSHFTVEGGQFVMQGLFEKLKTHYQFEVEPVARLPE